MIPLTLALLVGNAVLPSRRTGEPSVAAKRNADQAVVCGEVANVNECHTDYPTGCSAAGRYDPYLNLLKNQLDPPAPTAAFRYFTGINDYYDLETKTPPGLGKGAHLDFKKQMDALGEGQTFGVIGYLFYASQTGAESSNCQLTGDDDVDYHLGIGFDPALAQKAKTPRRLTPAEARRLKQTSVIVEITPHYRAYKQPNWTLEAVKSAVGMQVRVMGQLMFDSEHDNPSQNCAFSNADRQKCWRASAWELHPVTRFEICSPGNCTETSGQWTELEQLDVADLR